MRKNQIAAVLGLVVIVAIGFALAYNYKNKTTPMIQQEKLVNKANNQPLTQEEEQAVAVAWQELLKHHPDGIVEGKKYDFYGLVHSLRRDPSVSIIFAAENKLETGISMEVDTAKMTVFNYEESPK